MGFERQPNATDIGLKAVTHVLDLLEKANSQ